MHQMPGQRQRPVSSPPPTPQGTFCTFCRLYLPSALPSKRTWHGNTSYHIACTATARGQVGASLTPVPRVTAGASQLPTRQDPRTSHSLFSPHRP